MDPSHQEITELVLHHPDIPADPSAYYPTEPVQQPYEAIQQQQQHSVPMAYPHHPQSTASCVQMTYTVVEQTSPSAPSMQVGYLHPLHNPQQQPQQQPAKQCKCKCTCEASAPSATPQVEAPTPTAVPCSSTSAGPSKPTKPKSTKGSKPANSSALPDSPNRSPVARVAGPPPPPVPLVEELHSYSCRICGKTFKLKGAVVVHMRVHSLERKHSCNYCDMKFKDTNSLRQHIRRHTGERPYQCSYCDKAFKQQSGLMQHERLHTGERPYACRFCQRTFVQKNHVDRHERAHTGDKPYTCRHCGAAFVDRSGLNQHAFNQHGEEPLKLTPAGTVPRGSGRPRKQAECVEELDNPVVVAKKAKVEPAVYADDAGEDGRQGVEEANVEYQSGNDEQEHIVVTETGAVKRVNAKGTQKFRKRKRREEGADNPQKALWKAGLAPHPGGRPPKHVADVLVLPAPVSIVRTGRKRMSQTLVEDLALLPPREQIRSRGRPRKEEERAMLEAGARMMQSESSEDDMGVIQSPLADNLSEITVEEL
ncbi:zinc finger protein 551-like [Amphibalanus amphitrite]|uniref:zinc finger protein 551-like n=1 Tax=Amphibalanus amphitrite TaxID=1232801 RepID=UPI001C9213C3|nr:zinc finger protein 551-like [Amphibalanus amphitrite]XP_043241660.1 zinc finger protein 551-like [Amphibalanus amphitrite]XP_043241661.1 zinc finger protein 551-like [Amphibalanus amphitrite]